MKTTFAASVLSALLYAQGLLGFAGVVSVLLKERAHTADSVVVGGGSRHPGAGALTSCPPARRHFLLSRGLAEAPAPQAIAGGSNR